MSSHESDAEDAPKSLLGKLIDDPEAMRSLTDAIIPALLEGFSRQKVRLVNDDSVHEIESRPQAGANAGSNKSGPISHESYSSWSECVIWQ